MAMASELSRGFIGGIACPPESLVEGIAARANELRDVWIWHLPLLGKVPFVTPEFRGSFRLTTSFIGPICGNPWPRVARILSRFF